MHYHKFQLLAILTVTLFLTFGSLAHATDLEDAIADYNTKASALSSQFNMFSATRDTAFDDYELMLQLWLVYIEYESGDPDELWQDFLDQYDVAVSSGEIAEAHFFLLAASLKLAAEALVVVMDEDDIDASSVAYQTGTAFTLSSDPLDFIFWKDPNKTMSHWPACEFPTLEVRPNTFASYQGSNWTAIIGLVAGVSGWITFYNWAQQHYDDGTESNTSRAQDYNGLCNACNGGPYVVPAIYHGCYDRFCFVHEDSCSDPQSDEKKAADLRDACPEGTGGDTQVPLDAAEDYTIPGWLQ